MQAGVGLSLVGVAVCPQRKAFAGLPFYSCFNAPLPFVRKREPVLGNSVGQTHLLVGRPASVGVSFIVTQSPSFDGCSCQGCLAGGIVMSSAGLACGAFMVVLPCQLVGVGLIEHKRDFFSESFCLHTRRLASMKSLDSGLGSSRTELPFFLSLGVCA